MPGCGKEGRGRDNDRVWEGMDGLGCKKERERTEWK